MRRKKLKRRKHESTQKRTMKEDENCPKIKKTRSLSYFLIVTRKKRRLKMAFKNFALKMQSIL